jgi:hypothetical protein
MRVRGAQARASLCMVPSASLCFQSNTAQLRGCGSVAVEVNMFPLAEKNLAPTRSRHRNSASAVLMRNCATLRGARTQLLTLVDETQQLLNLLIEKGPTSNTQQHIERRVSHGVRACTGACTQQWVQCRCCASTRNAIAHDLQAVAQHTPPRSSTRHPLTSEEVAQQRNITDDQRPLASERGPGSAQHTPATAHATHAQAVGSTRPGARVRRMQSASVRSAITSGLAVGLAAIGLVVLAGKLVSGV